MRRWYSIVILGWVFCACQDNGLAPTQQRPAQTEMQWDSGYIMRSGVPSRVVFQVRNGRAVFEGDIDLGAADNIAKTKEQLQSDPQRGPTGVVPIADSKRWPSGRIPYIFAAAPFPVLSAAQTQIIVDAMANIRTQAGGVYFQTKNSWDSDYLVFRPTTESDICGSSQVGKIGGAQTVLIHEGCNVGGVMHELGHALGFWHEQSRCDRDNFVQILWDNIVDGRSDQFEIAPCGPPYYIAQDLEAYDESSIMHYRSDAFGKQGPNGQLQTIRSLRGLDALMGQRNGLSNIDAFTVDRMYQPYGPLIYSITNQNGNPLISWSHSGRAIAYYVTGVRTYEEWDDYAGTYSSYDEYMPIGCSSSGLSCTDTQSTFTGNSLCQLWQNVNGSADYRYYYEIVAHFANGIVSSIARSEAPIAPSAAPCPDGY